ncbi:hypothetical protein TNCT_556681 [Trichonephila clavata]|uniref:Uncharacterized protein n=1 Tax=Trichonephila clavata TaxID=2740835 RepID=A0A8X6HNY8_TRICU|nr:hypothetical protein TNCT_556681 [Trichonephila clavata]
MYQGSLRMTGRKVKSSEGRKASFPIGRATRLLLGVLDLFDEVGSESVTCFQVPSIDSKPVSNDLNLATVYLLSASQSFHKKVSSKFKSNSKIT